jgi:hypothetical protein
MRQPAFVQIAFLQNRNSSDLLARTDRQFRRSEVEGENAMTIKTFFSIIAVLALVHGVGFVLVPEQVAASYGMATSVSTILMARLFGAALIGLGLVFWFARGGTSETSRGVLIATVVGNTIGLIVVVLGSVCRDAQLNGMGRCFDLSLRSGGVWLLRYVAIASDFKE